MIRLGMEEVQTHMSFDTSCSCRHMWPASTDVQSCKQGFPVAVNKHQRSLIRFLLQKSHRLVQILPHYPAL
jgi:hypothetical protein